MSIYGVERYLERAREFIKASDENSLRHACLELRLCIETIVYRKLEKVGDVLPRDIYKTWQPPKALKLLLSFEPRADKAFTVEICLNTENGQPSGEWIRVGDHKSLTVKWLNGNYHKLGKYLHATAISEVEGYKHITILDLERIILELERVSSADMVGSVNRVNKFDCECCGGPVYASSEQIENSAVVECYSDICWAVYKVSAVNADHYRFDRDPKSGFECRKCGSMIAIDGVSRQEKIKCWSCQKEYEAYWSSIGVRELK
jgi:hypothetical protein